MRNSLRNPPPPAPSRWLQGYALLTAAATLALLGVGGLVTSHGVGMAVPDWPNTYGYNMFLFPVSQWIGGILYEHSHRLVAALVGMLTAVLAAWLWARETRRVPRWVGLAAIVVVLGLMGARRMPVYLVLAGLALAVIPFALVQTARRPGLRWLGMAALAAVILQGVLGGLRVVWLEDQIGILHATLAQLFFALLCAVCLMTGRWWQRQPGPAPAHPGPLAWLLPATTLLVLAQLVLGASMRHQHAGLAIPDFPLAYASLWPDTSPEAIARYNQQRIEVTAANPITAAQVVLQMVHRLVAAAILSAVTACVWQTRRRLDKTHPVSKLALGWLGLVILQFLLGAATIWSNKAADIATAHVLGGALSLALGVIASLVWFRILAAAPRTEAVPRPSVSQDDTRYGIPPATASI